MSGRKLMSTLALPLMLTACGLGSGGQGIECAGWKPITFSRADVLSRDTETMILAHNQFGVARGCWKAPR